MIYRASHNRMLMQMLSSYQIYVKYQERVIGDTEQYLNDVLDEHRAIYKAFIMKDPEAGAEAMRIHMDNSIARHGR